MANFSFFFSFFCFLQITDSHGNPVYRKENAVKGKFAFSSDAYDVYEICFESTLQGV